MILNFSIFTFEAHYLKPNGISYMDIEFVVLDLDKMSFCLRG